VEAFLKEAKAASRVLNELSGREKTAILKVMATAI